jgi:hypothetical protein
MSDALFLRDGDTYLPTELAGGPWNPQHLHGGPPAGLLAHVLEAAVGNSGMRLGRLTVDLLRPVPRAPLRVDVTTIRAGRRIQLLGASLLADGVEVCRASGLFLERQELDVPEFARFPDQQLPSRQGLPVSTLADIASFFGGRHNVLVGLHTTAEACWIDGIKGEGIGRAWMRLPVPVVAGEPASPTVQVATLSDFGNGVGQLRVTPDIGCINADISLYLHRPPRGEWLGLHAVGKMEDNGGGLAETMLYDDFGPIGRVVQATLAMPVYRPGS